MPKRSVNFTRHHGWAGKHRVQTTLRLPDELHKKVMKQAVRHKQTINDYLITAIEAVLNKPPEEA